MRRYGRSYDRPECLTDCVVSVRGGGGAAFGPHQCWNKRGRGPGGLYCAQHAKMVRDGKKVWVPEDK